MAYAFIHGEVKGSGASVEFKGNGLDLLDLTIQIVGSVVAEVPEPLRPYVIKKIQDKIPDAVQNDLEAQGKAAPAEKKEKPPVGETVGFRMARQFAETEPGFKGDTATGATKPAIVETGATVYVPLFVEQGDVIKIDTRTGEYLSRV